MKISKSIIYSSVALLVGATSALGQNIVTNTVSGASNVVGKTVSGTTGAVKGVASGAINTVKDPVGSVKSVGGSTVSGLKGLASMPGKALSISDNSLPDLSAGTQEFGIGGNVQFGGDVIYNLDISYGYFFKDNWEVGFNAGIQGADSQLSLGLGLFTEYNFDFDSKWVPFVGASVGLATLSTDDGGSAALNDDINSIEDATSVTLGGVFGMKYFLRENIAITGSVDFTWSPDDVFGGVEDAASNASNINIGTRFYF